MPELPEVETSRRGIEPHRWRHHSARRRAQRTVALAGFRRDLSPERRSGAQRATSRQIFASGTPGRLDHRPSWDVGSLRILSEELPAEKHDHVDLVMSNGKVLRYTDPRRFGAWLWTKELEGHPVLAHLGPEPLSDAFNADYLQQKCAKKKTAIKPG